MIYVAKRIENEKSLKKINLLFHHEFTSKKDILIVLDGEETLTYLKEGHDISFFGKIVLVFFSKINFFRKVCLFRKRKWNQFIYNQK